MPSSRGNDQSPPAADWNKWSEIPQEKLWCVVAVSLDIDPTFLEYAQGIHIPFDPTGPVPIVEHPREFLDRLQIAEANLGLGLPVVQLFEERGRKHDSIVRLAEFGAWARWKGLSLPDEFPVRARRPNWQTWRQMALVDWPEALALSCDLEPADVRSFKPDDYPDLWDRYGIALSHLKAGSLTRNADNEVLLQAFGAWAHGLGWDLPREFPLPPSPPASVAVAREVAPAPSPPSGGAPTPTTGVSVTLPHTTKTLDALFKVMSDHWTSFDPRNPPKSTVLAEELDKALGWAPRGDGTPSRGAQTLVAAIRPDALANADRRTQTRGPAKKR